MPSNFTSAGKAVTLVLVLIMTACCASHAVDKATSAETGIKLDVKAEPSKSASEAVKVSPVESKPAVQALPQAVQPEPVKQAAISPSSPLTTGSPIDVIKRYEREVKEVATKYKGKGDKASVDMKNNEILAKVSQFFDISELGRLSLGIHWEKINQAQQKEYSDVFKQLIERSYVSKSDKLIGDYDVKYNGETINGTKADVKSAVIKEDADVDIQYKMHRVGNSWMIYNIIVDSTNLVKNYNSQFNSIIGKEGFAGLMKKMRNKLSEQED